MLRRTLFRLHLLVGLLAGLVIGIKCLTGLPLAFEKELLAWSEAEVRTVSVPAEAKRLELSELIARVREQRENKLPSGITVSATPEATVVLQFGREETVYVNPYTGEVLKPASSKMKSSLRFIEDLHRFLALSGESRDIGKNISGVATILFVFLALSGLFLWWPRHLSWRSFKAVTRFNLRLKGKARDWNWHTTLGFWATPMLLVLSLSGLTLSYRWASNLGATLVGDPAVQQGQAGSNRGPALPTPPEGAKRLSSAQLLDIAAKAHPDFEQLTLRQESPGGNRRGPGPEGGRSDGKAKNREAEVKTGPTPAQAVAIQLKEPKAWPRTATTALYLNPYSGEIMKTERFADLSAGQRLRHWLRYLHTGEALGWPGQIAALLASLVGFLLFYTGFALAWRRFFTDAKA